MAISGSVHETLALRALGRSVISSDDRMLRDNTGAVVAENSEQIAVALAKLVADVAGKSAGRTPFITITWRGVDIAAGYDELNKQTSLCMWADNREHVIPLIPERIHDAVYLRQTAEQELDRATRFVGPEISAQVTPREAVDQLRRRWAFLSCHQVEHATARDPEDVFRIELQRPIRRRIDGTMVYSGVDSAAPSYRRMSDIPKADRDRARVLWCGYHGHTTDQVTFDYSTSTTLELSNPRTLDWTDAMHSERILPRPGQWLYGEVEHRGTERVMRHWSPCGPEFPLLLDLLRSDEPLRYTEDELALLLLTDGFPDTLWAIARLVFFDNVQAFVDAAAVGSPALTASQLFLGQPAPKRTGPTGPARHPAHGMRYGRDEVLVDWEGMYLEIDPSQFVHEMSSLLGQPHWWQQFVQLAAEQGVAHSHPGEGGVCRACEQLDPHWYTNGFPYQQLRSR